MEFGNFRVKSPFKPFRDLEVYQKTIQLSDEITNLPFLKNDELSDIVDCHCPLDSFTYCSSDGFLVIKLTTSSTYYMGFTVSGWFVNPTGNDFDISANIYQQDANL